MNRILLIGIVVVIAACLIAAGILGRPAFTTLGIVVVPMGVWIYLVWMFRKRKTSIFHDRMEPELAESRLKRLKALLLVAGVSLAVGIVGVILHNVLSAAWETEEAVSFAIALVGLFVFVIASIGALVTFLIGRRKPRQ